MEKRYCVIPKQLPGKGYLVIQIKMLCTCLGDKVWSRPGPTAVLNFGILMDQKRIQTPHSLFKDFKAD